MQAVKANTSSVKFVKCINIIDHRIVETQKVIDLTKFDCQNQALEELLESFDVVEF